LRIFFCFHAHYNTGSCQTRVNPPLWYRTGSFAKEITNTDRWQWRWRSNDSSDMQVE